MKRERGQERMQQVSESVSKLLGQLVTHSDHLMITMNSIIALPYFNHNTIIDISIDQNQIIYLYSCTTCSTLLTLSKKVYIGLQISHSSFYLCIISIYHIFLAYLYIYLSIYLSLCLTIIFIYSSILSVYPYLSLSICLLY